MSSSSSSSGIEIEPLFFRTVTRHLVTVRKKVVVLKSIAFFPAAPCNRTDLNKHNASLGKFGQADSSIAGVEQITAV